MRIFLCLGCLMLGLARGAEARGPVLLLSLDGFRWDYLDRHPDRTPHLQALRREGVSARGLIPAFPSNTFPNHYTLVTGRYPARHGIVNNEFFDPADGRFFRYVHPPSNRDPRWWGAEPIWITAVRQGVPAATALWVGSEVEIGGRRATYWKPFDYRIPFPQRVDEVVGWLGRPAGERPALVAFYLEETNSAGHRFGPDSPELAAAVGLLDGHVGTLLARVRALGREPEVVVVSDHGMTATHLDRTVALEDYLDLKTVHVDSDGSVVTLRPREGAEVAAILQQLRRVPHAQAYRAEELPARFQLRDNPRIAPLWLLPEPGWHVATRANLANLKKSYVEKGFLGGDHGYDPQHPEMQGIFIAHGPSFRRGVTLPATENVHVYALLCALLGVTPAVHDGDDRLVQAALAR
ncbi:MAG: ectonucleotide pyrophosphatase/phosphodiesterase [Opitutaceae bacterium]